MKLEEVKLTTGLQTDVSPKAVDTQKNRLVVNPILQALNARYVSSENGSDFLFQSVKGNSKVDNADLPSGTNVMIGWIEDIQNNALVYFLYNSNNNHGIYKYSPDAGTITTIIQSEYLNFQNNPRYLITGVGIQGNMLYWSDGYNPQRAINMTRDYSTIKSDKPITLIKEHPTERPEVLDSAYPLNGNPYYRSDDASIPLNKIADKNLQFSYQYIFIDNEKSVIAPYSMMSFAWTNAVSTYDNTTKNRVAVRVTIPGDIVAFVKQVRLLVREGNTGTWSIWKKINPQDEDIAEYYTGYESLEGIADTEASKIQEAVPTLSKALAVHRNRVLVSADEENFDVNLVAGEFPISITLSEQFETPATITPPDAPNAYFKRGGSRTFAIAVFDEKGRSMGVFGKKNIKFTPANDNNSRLDDGPYNTDTQRPYVTLTLTGDLSLSPKAKYFSIVCTDEEYYEEYLQVPVLPLFYKYEFTSGLTLSADERLIDNRVYVDNNVTVGVLVSSFSRLHLLLPKEAAITPSNEYIVRLMNMRTTSPFDDAEIEPVIGVEDSQFVVINDFGIDWTGFTTNYDDNTAKRLFVEIFKLKSSPDNKFYEISDRIELVNGVPAQTSFTIYGDTYYIDHKFSFRNCFGVPVPDKTTARIESPTPTYGLSIPESARRVYRDDTDTSGGGFDRKVLDYAKKGWGKGKLFVELENPVQLDRSTVIRFSNPAIQDSFINGMSNFDSGDEKVLPVDRTPITKLVPVGNNVLAVHERSLTTLYIEQSMIKNTEGVEQLITTDKFIGYDRELNAKVGSYHPESVAEHLGLAFGFDVFKGVVWQYSNEGVSLVSNFGKENDIRAIAEAIRPYKDTCKVLGGIDPDNKEYIISFVFPDAQSDQNITLAYNWEKNFWTVEYSAVPEGYAKINRSLVSFKAGELWTHHTNALYNNFYGVQYQRILRIAVNPYPGRSKNWMALQIATNLLSSGSDAEMQVVKCYTEDGQETYMKADDFEKLEGVFYGPILKDVNTLGALIPAGKIALRDGDDMLGRYIEIELINDHTTDPCPVQFMNVTYVDSEYTK